MTFTASHVSKIYLSDNNSAFTEVDANEATFNTSREVIDVTDLGGSGWRDRLHGIKDWSVSLPNFWQSEGVVSKMLMNHVLSGTALYIRIDIDGTSSNRLSGRVISEGFEMGFNLSDAQKASQTLQGNGALTATLA